MSATLTSLLPSSPGFIRKLTLALAILSPTAVLAAPTAITNVKGYTATADSNWTSFSTLVFDDGKVLATGDKSLLKQFPKATIIDGKQKTLLPGLIDAHGHVLGLGFNQLNVDVRGLTSATASAQKVKAYSDKHPELNWIRGRGWNQVLWDKKEFPTAKDLDEYIADKPVWLGRVDGHAGWANTKALKLAGIDKNTVDPTGGEIIRDANGNPTGVLIDNAMDLLTEKIPGYSKQETQSALKLAQQHLSSLGITSVHDAGIGYNTWNLYQQAAKEKQLNVRLYPMLAATDPALEKMLKAGHIKSDDDFLSIRSVKVYADGALGSRGAALITPYSDKPAHVGLMLASPEHFTQLFNTILKYDFQINIHAIGDKANREALNHFEDGFKLHGGQQNRHRIEHAQVVHPDDIPRFKTLNIIPSMQPTHATSDMNMAEDRLGKQRLKGAYAWRTFLKQGSRIAAGSDFPVELANPFHGLHAAITRQNHQNLPKGGWIPAESLSTAEALTAFTIDAAWAAHQDDVIGSLEKGKWADFILIDDDIFSMPTTDIWKITVDQTWVAGKAVYRADK